MVGGSVSGKTFKPDPTSYEETGIPCGNPARYQSRGVVRMNRGDAQPFEDQRLGVPGIGTESEADQHLKGMVKNQLDTSVTLESQLSRKKSFTSASSYEPFCPEKTGALSLHDYQSRQTHKQYVQNLKECGFSQEEIQFKLEQEGLIPQAPKRSRYGVNPVAEQDRLNDLARRIKAREEALSVPDLYSNVRVVSRHALEVEQSLHKGTEKGSSLSHLVQPRPQAIPKNDPLLQTLMEEKWILSKSKQGSSSSGKSDKNQETPSGHSSENHDDGSSLVNQGVASEDKSEASVTSGCHGDPSKQDTCGINLPVNIQPVEEKEILENRLSLEQIRDHPKFANYQPGEPSGVLFIKNLHQKTTEADLVSLFIRFQKKLGPKITFRLMKGKMNGQAFVTMPDVSTATAALNLVNGFVFKGRPVIIQYGRQRNDPPNNSETPLNSGESDR